MRFGVFSFLGGAVGGFFLAKVWQYPPTSSQDWSGWAQAVAAAAAFGGAIWISTFETRARRYEQLELARVAAAGLAVRLAHIRIYLSVALASFETASVIDPGPPALDGLKRACNDIREDLVPSDEIKALSPLADDLAEKLASAIACIQLVKFDVLSRVDEIGSYPVEARRASITFWYEQLQDGLKYLAQVHDACARITKVKVYLVDGEP
ncbi:hypothetical protein [Pandoraea sputorum]